MRPARRANDLAASPGRGGRSSLDAPETGSLQIKNAFYTLLQSYQRALDTVQEILEPGTCARVGVCVCACDVVFGYASTCASISEEAAKR